MNYSSSTYPVDTELSAIPTQLEWKLGWVNGESLYYVASHRNLCLCVCQYKAASGKALFSWSVDVRQSMHLPSQEPESFESAFVDCEEAAFKLAKEWLIRIDYWLFRRRPVAESIRITTQEVLKLRDSGQLSAFEDRISQLTEAELEEVNYQLEECA